MPSKVRQRRVAELIREDMSRMILFDLGDPRLQAVTVTRAEVSSDLRYAKVYVSIMGTDEEQRKIMAIMQRSRGKLRRMLALRANHLRFVPEIRFMKDDSVKKAIRIEEKFKQIEQERLSREQAAVASQAESEQAQAGEEE